MKWKDSGVGEPSGDTEDETYFEEAYSPLKSRKFDLGPVAASLFGKPVFWIAVAAVLIVILVLVFIPGSGRDDRPLAMLEQRIAQFENRVVALEEINNRLSALEKDVSGAKPLKARLEGLETSLAKKMNEMEEKIDQVARRSAASAAPRDTKAVESKTQERFHVVQKGDTLYSISKRYGLTVEQLRKLNNLSKDSAIQPGQKLLVK